MSDDEQKRTARDILRICAGYGLKCYDDNSMSEMIDLCPSSPNTELWVEVSSVCDREEKQFHGARKKHHLGNLPGTWSLTAAGALNWRSWRTQLGPLLDGVVKDGAVKFDCGGGGYADLAQLGLTCGEQLSPAGSAYVLFRIGALHGYSLGSLTVAIEEAIQDNHDKLASQAKSALFLFVEPPTNAEASFDILSQCPTYQPFPAVDLQGVVDEVWVARREVEEWSVWRTDGTEWRHFRAPCQS